MHVIVQNKAEFYDVIELKPTNETINLKCESDNITVKMNNEVSTNVNDMSSK